MTREALMLNTKDVDPQHAMPLRREAKEATKVYKM
jgi:hypothetical protein